MTLIEKALTSMKMKVKKSSWKTVNQKMRVYSIV